MIRHVIMSVVAVQSWVSQILWDCTFNLTDTDADMLLIDHIVLQTI